MNRFVTLFCGSCLIVFSAESQAQQTSIVYARTASVRYEKNVEIPAPSSGLISELIVEEGKSVVKGEVLANLDQRIAKAEYEVAIQESVAAEKQAEDNSNILYANKVSEVANAEYENYLELFRKGSTAAAELRRKKLEAEKSKLSIRVAELEQSKNISSSLVSKEKVKAAEVQLNLRKITAPFDGVIAETHLKQDAWAREGDKIITLVAMEELRVEGIAQEGLEKVAPHTLLGAPVTIEVIVAKDNPPVVIESTIGFVSPIIYGGSGSGPKVWSKIKNQQIDGQWILRDGMTATMKIKVGSPKPAQPVTPK
jgi:multidrug resistance efflux pump